MDSTRGTGLVLRFVFFVAGLEVRCLVIRWLRPTETVARARYFATLASENGCDYAINIIYLKVG